MSCPDCTRLRLALARLRAKSRVFAEQTNALLTEQAQEIALLRAIDDASDLRDKTPGAPR